MQRRLTGALIAALAGLLPLLLVSYTRPGQRALALDVYLLYLGGVLLPALVQAAREAQPLDPHSPFALALARRRPRPRDRLKELVREEREVALSMDAAYDLHVRLRPTLRLIAEHRLASRRGVDLDSQQERARELLGDEAWDLVRADRDPPQERFARGIAPDTLREIVDRIERL